MKIGILHYRSAIPLGLLAKVGSVGTQRLACPVSLTRSDPDDPCEGILRQRVLREAKQRLTPRELLVVDRGFPRRSPLGRSSSRPVVSLRLHLNGQESKQDSFVETYCNRRCAARPTSGNRVMVVMVAGCPLTNEFPFILFDGE